MGLNIKSTDDVFKKLVEWTTAKTTRITDFNVGSAIRTLYEAISVQFEEFYYDMKQNIVYAIENAVYNSFGFELKVATKATGYVTIEYESPLPDVMLIPKGTMFCTSASYGYIYYECYEDLTVPTGTLEVLVPVRCIESGKIGNVPSGAITTIVTSNQIISRVYNAYDFTNGTDNETSVERKRRFKDFIKALSRGTRDSIIYGALEVEGVAGAMIDDNYVGYCKLFVHDSDGELPDELKQRVADNIENYRSAGIEVIINPIIKKEVDITTTVVIDNEYDTDIYNALIRTTIISFLNDLKVGENLYVSDLIHVLKSTYDDIIINIILNEDLKDIKVEKNELIHSGVVNVTCMNLRDWRK